MVKDKHCKENTCCFFGHRKIQNIGETESKVYEIVEYLIVKKGVFTFLFGSKSAFDDLCHEVVTHLKEKYPHIKRVYVRAEYPYIDETYKKYLLENYEDTYYPPKIINAGKGIYVERNREMIDKSRFCVVYMDEAYDSLKGKSGTKIAYDYAIKRKVEIINVITQELVIRK